MDLFDAISKRKSCRAYADRPLDDEQLQKICDAIKGFTPLYPEQSLKWRFVKSLKGPFLVKAPHYLVVSGKGEKGEAENAGFIYQQLMLWFSTRGIGNLWQGGPKDVKRKKTSGKDIIAIAFGRPKEAVYRDISEFKRKPITEITNDPDDPRIQAAHLAPSGLNLQPWYFEKTDNQVLLYRENPKLGVGFVYKLTDLDMGIALCHYALACQRLGQPFVFKRRTEKGNKKGYELFGELE